MSFARIVLYFFICFFGLQFFFGEAGLISLIQINKSTLKLDQNIEQLEKISDYLGSQVVLNKENKSYLLMNAHRVGLLGENEFLIKLDTPVFFKSVIYSPGSIIINKNQFYFSNVLLFFFALIFTTLILCVKIVHTIIHLTYNKNDEVDNAIENSVNQVLDPENTENINII